MHYEDNIIAWYHMHTSQRYSLVPTMSDLRVMVWKMFYSTDTTIKQHGYEEGIPMAKYTPFPNCELVSMLGCTMLHILYLTSYLD